MSKDLIQTALEHHRAGRLAQAKRVYEQILVTNPQEPDALHLLGVVALQTGDAERAAALIEQAVGLWPEHPGFHANLAQALLASHRVEDAHAAFLRAAQLEPANPQFTVGVANCLSLLGKAAQSEALLRTLAQEHPGSALAWLNLAHVLRDQRKFEQAAALYRRTIELEPSSAVAHNALGSALHSLERFDEAESAYRRHLELQPDSADGHCNLASLLIDRGQFAAARAVCRQALERGLESADLRLMLGSVHAFEGDFAAALGAFRAAANLAPDNARARWALGTALFETGDIERGLAQLHYALQLQPDATYHYGLSGIYLALGELPAGWEEYETRPSRVRFVGASPDLDLVTEVPESMSGKRILLVREQGLGDELFFLRFAALLKSRGAEVCYLASPRLVAMLGRLPALDRIIPGNDEVPPSDMTLLVGDLPRALSRSASSRYHPRTVSRDQGSTPSSVRQLGLARHIRVFCPEIPPALTLAPLPHVLERVGQRLAGLGPPPYLGVTWRAGTAPEKQRGATWSLHKQVAPVELGAVLREVPGTIIVLQRNPKAGEIEELVAAIARPVHDLSGLNEDLEDMLALLALIDDYIGVSNTNMHLRAGAGRTAHVLMPRPADWRWMAAGDESPWFPGFRIYRQRPDGDWREALARLAADLAAVG